MLLTHKPDSVYSAKATRQTRSRNKTEQKFQNGHLNHRQDEAVPAFSAGKFSCACYNQEISQLLSRVTNYKHLILVKHLGKGISLNFDC